MSDLAPMECNATKALIEIAYSIFSPKVDNFRELYYMYHAQHTKSRSGGDWDPRRSEDSIQILKTCLLDMEPERMSISEQDSRRRILWSWYYHAMGYALWLNSGMTVEERSSLAHELAMEMLNVHWFAESHSNSDQLTLARVWFFIVNNDLDEAAVWLETLKNGPYKREARDLVNVHFRLRRGMPTVKPLMIPA